MISIPLSTARVLSAEDFDVRIRVTWGGGAKRQWRGTMVARDGQLTEPKCLGVEADVADELVLYRDTLRFAQPMPVSADGLDVRVIGTGETKLVLELAPFDKPDAIRQVELLLSDVVATSKAIHDSPLDDRGNTLHVQRVPSDRLRVEFERSSLVFSPGEEFSFQVRPHEWGLAEGTAWRCTLQLHPVDTKQVVWKEQHDLRVGASGRISEMGPIKLAVPTEEGVYDLVISLIQRRFADSLVPGSLVPAKPLIQRNVQLLVLDDEPQLASPATWELVDEIDSGNPKWWERLNWLPQWKVLPGKSPRVPLGDRPLQRREYLGQPLSELGPHGWHAAPIPIAEIGQPHILEVDYPDGQRQTLSISVVEPNAAGEVRTAGLDSGLDVPGIPTPTTAKLEKHRLVFWPRTKTPWLVLTNRRVDDSAAFGKIRVFAGPAQLPPLEVPSVEGGRMLVASYDKPLFPENFGAAEALDLATGRSHKDWQTFYLGGLRLIEYLKYAGYDSAIIPVVCEGGALFPSQSLTATPKFDDGALFHSGQDPVPKDVVEMLLRLFDREGLKLIPAIQFSSLLPDLEEELRSSRTDLGGIAMIGFFPGDPKPKLGRADSRQGAAPFYNPLDLRVQTAMRKVAAEVLERCATHPAFAGLAVQLSPHGYAVLPDDTWCLDDATFARFSQKTELVNPTGQDRLEQRVRLIRGAARESWLRWRAAELTKFYQALSADVRRTKSDAKLILAISELSNGRVMQNMLRPRLPDQANFADAMLRHGLDADGLSEVAESVLLRPRQTTVSARLAECATQLELAQSEVVDDYFRRAKQTGALTVTETVTWRLPQFDQVSPFGPENTATVFAAQITATDGHRRAPFVQFLTSLDSTLIADGGGMLPLGQERSLTQFFRIYRQLPAAPFTTIRPLSGSVPSQIVVRSLAYAGRTYIYVANPSGLAASVTLELEAPTACVAEPLGDHSAPQFSPSGGGRTTWLLELDPYDVAAIVCSANDTRVANWSVKIRGDSLPELTNMVQQFRVRVDQLVRFQPVQVIPNPDFEQPAQPGQIPGWRFSRNPGVIVDIDSAAAMQGKQSLHFKVAENKTLGWISSQPFPLPRTGRISVQAWIRTREAERQPPLRMSINGQLAGGQPYYRWSALGTDVDSRTLLPSGRKARAVPTHWVASPFLLHLTDLPATAGSEISVRFDMLGAGEVWIDDIQISDVYFEDSEQKELLKNVAYARFQLQKGALVECQRFLQGFWPQFVLEYVPPPRLAQTPTSTLIPPEAEKSTSKVPEEKSSRWRLLPKNRLKFEFK